MNGMLSINALILAINPMKSSEAVQWNHKLWLFQLDREISKSWIMPVLMKPWYLDASFGYTISRVVNTLA